MTNPTVWCFPFQIYSRPPQIHYVPFDRDLILYEAHEIWWWFILQNEQHRAISVRWPKNIVFRSSFSITNCARISLNYLALNQCKTHRDMGESVARIRKCPKRQFSRLRLRCCELLSLMLHLGHHLEQTIICASFYPLCVYANSYFWPGMSTSETLQQMTVPKAGIRKMLFWVFYDPRDRFADISMSSEHIEMRHS